MSIKQVVLQGLSSIYTRANDFVSETKLSNGITFASQRRISEKNLEFSVLVNVGSYEDPDDKQGIAHFLEHLLIGPETNRQMRRLGGQVDLSISAFFIQLSGSLPNSSENKEFLGNLIARFLTGLDMTEEDFHCEKKRILNEIGIAHDNAGRHQATLLGEGFANNRADGSILGTRDQVRSISYGDLQDFKEQYFTGRNIFIGITGAYSFKEMQSILEKNIGKLESGTPSLLYSPSLNPEYKNIQNENLLQTYFNFCFPVDAVSKGNYEVVDLAQNYLNIKMEEEIIFGSGIVYQANFRGLYDTLRKGSFDLTGNIMPEDADKVVPEISALITRVIDGIDEDVFEGVKTSYLSHIPSGSWFPSTHDAQDISFGTMLSMERIPMAKYEERVRNITAEGIQRYLIDDVFSSDPAIVIYGDDTKMGSYDDFVEPIRKSLARVNNPCPK